MKLTGISSCGLAGNLLNLAPRPMIYAWGFRDWRLASEPFCCYPLVMTNIASENGYLQWIYPWKIVIFHSYVKLPEGTYLPDGDSACFYFYLLVVRCCVCIKSLTNQVVETWQINNVGIAIMSHPPKHHFYGWDSNHQK